MFWVLLGNSMKCFITIEGISVDVVGKMRMDLYHIYETLQILQQMQSQCPENDNFGNLRWG